jgi:hypothetical protein
VTLIEPTLFQPIAVDPVNLGFPTIGTVQPFSPRAGIGYQDLLETLRVYITQDIYNAISALGDPTPWNDSQTKLVNAIDAALTTQQNNVTADLTTVLNQIAAGENAALNNATILSALQSANSAVLNFLDTQFAPLSVAAKFDGNILNVWEHGVLADGTTNDGPALAAILAGITTRTLVRFPTGKTINLGSTVINLDVSLAAFEGHSTVLSGTGAFNVFSSQAYAGRQKNWHEALRGIVLSGIPVSIGHASYTESGMFRFRDGGIMNGSITFITNAWKIVFDHFHVQGSPVASTGGANTGENMIFRDSMFADGSTISLAGGDWHFDGCSFDNLSIVLTGDAVVTFDSPHFEDNAGQSRRILSLSGSGTTAVINGGILVLDSGTGNWTEAPFFVDPATINGGLVINGLQVPMHDYFTPEVTDNLRVLVAGGGTAVFNGIRTFDTPGVGYALGEAANLIANGDAETGNANSWTGSGTGSYVNDTAVKNRGTKSHKINAPANQNYQFYQDFPVTPGRTLWAQFWRSFAPGTGGQLNSQINFFDRLNNQIGSFGYGADTTAQTGIRSFITQVPKGAAYARVYFYLTGGSAGTATANIDDVIANCA